MNRTEMIAVRMGRNSRWDTHIPGFKLPQRRVVDLVGDIVPPEVAKELEELNKEASDFPPIEVWLKGPTQKT